MQTIAKFYAPKEAARELGVHVSAIYRAVAAGELPVVRLTERGAIHIPREALEPRETERS